LAVGDFRRVTAALHNLIEIRGYRDIVLDFVDCSFTHAPPMVALICDCLRYRDQGIDFALVGPSDISLNHLFINSNWARFLDPERFSKSYYAPAKHNPVTQFNTAEEHSGIVNRVIDTLLASMSGFTRAHLSAIEWSLNEIMDNVLVHAHSPAGGIVQVTAIKNKKRVEFVVGDCGVGIASSLRQASNVISSDVDALSQAIQEGVTRDRKIGQGNGLYGTYRLAVSSAGNFSIYSNSATLYYAESSGMHSKYEPIPFNGAVVTCGIDYSNELLLGEALKFRDRSFEPVDYIQMKYETDQDGTVLFQVIQEAASVGSRMAGAPVRNKLANLIRVTGAKQILVDFRGVAMISSSFADEVFGKIFVEVGAIEFSTKLRFVNLDPTVRKLIDRSVMQRAALGPDS